MILIAVVTGVLGVYQTLLSNQVGQRVMHDLRSAVYRHLQRLSLAFFTRTRTGEVQSRIASDIGGVQNVVTSTATSIVSNVTTVIASVIAMSFLDWRLAIFSLGLLPLFIALTRRVGAERRRITTTRRETIADMSSIVQESLSVSGILLGKTMGRADALADRFETESARLAELEVRQRMAGGWVMASIGTSFAVMPAAVYWFAGQAWVGVGRHHRHRRGVHHPPDAAVPPDHVAAVRADRRADRARAVRSDLRVRRSAGGDRRAPHPVELDRATLRGDVAFQDVAFRYAGADHDTIDHLTLTVPAGTTTAIVGETGSGKTTLGYLVARLYDPDSGRVTIDGHDVRDLGFGSLADAVGVVSQETYLVHATVRENIRFARPVATGEEVEVAARAARIHHVIAALPEGYDTVVGERGHRFSGGEKQRIAIARTVLRNPPILLLDEATSALDNETVRAVQWTAGGSWSAATTTSSPRAAATTSRCSPGPGSSSPPDPPVTARGRPPAARGCPRR